MTPASNLGGSGQRWPEALAVLLLVNLPLLLPEHLTLRPGWILPAIGALFLGFVVVVADPSRTGGRAQVARALRIGLTFVLIVGEHG